MNIRQATKDDISAFIALFKKAYEGMGHVPDDEFSCFEKELRASFDIDQVYRIHFFAMENEAGDVVAFAGMAPTLFMHGSWELRWDTTHPEFQRQGLMTQLTEHRINYAIETNKGVPGIVQVAARQPNIYKKLGFNCVFERDIENYVMYLVKEI